MEDVEERGSDQRHRRESRSGHDPSLREASVKRVEFTKSARNILVSDMCVKVPQTGEFEAIRLTPVHVKLIAIECA